MTVNRSRKTSPEHLIRQIDLGDDDELEALLQMTPEELDRELGPDADEMSARLLQRGHDALFGQQEAPTLVQPLKLRSESAGASVVGYWLKRWRSFRKRYPNYVDLSASASATPGRELAPRRPDQLAVRMRQMLQPTNVLLGGGVLVVVYFVFPGVKSLVDAAFVGMLRGF